MTGQSKLPSKTGDLAEYKGVLYFGAKNGNSVGLFPVDGPKPTSFRSEGRLFSPRATSVTWRGPADESPAVVRPAPVPQRPAQVVVGVVAPSPARPLSRLQLQQLLEQRQIETLICQPEEAEGLLRHGFGVLPFSASNSQARAACVLGFVVMRIASDSNKKRPGGFVFAVARIEEKFWDDARARREITKLCDAEFARKKYGEILRQTRTVSLHLSIVGVFVRPKETLPQLDASNAGGTLVNLKLTSKAREAAKVPSAENKAAALRALAKLPGCALRYGAAIQAP